MSGSILAKKQELKKHTSAIHSSGGLSLLERKISNILLYNAYDDLLVSRFHEIKISLLSEMCGYNSKDIEGLKNSIRKLSKITVEWDVLDENGNKEEWGISSMLASVRLLSKGICRYEYSQSLAEKLKEPEVYGSINLQMQKRFSSGHTLTIYEMCLQYKGLLKKRNEAYTKWISLDDFKKIVGVEGSEYYNDFRRLNEKIIKSSAKEINGTTRKFIGTDIIIKPEYKKIGRAISDIRFLIKLNPQMSLAIGEDLKEEFRDKEVYSQLINCGLTDSGALNIIQSYDEDYISEKLEIVNKAEQEGKVKKSLGGYLKSALDDNYQKPKKVNDETRKRKQVEAQKQNAESRREDRERKARKVIREQYIESLSPKEQKLLLASLLKNQNTFVAKNIENLRHPSLALSINELIPDFAEKVKEASI